MTESEHLLEELRRCKVWEENKAYKDDKIRLVLGSAEYAKSKAQPTNGKTTVNRWTPSQTTREHRHQRLW